MLNYRLCWVVFKIRLCVEVVRVTEPLFWQDYGISTQTLSEFNYQETRKTSFERFNWKSNQMNQRCKGGFLFLLTSAHCWHSSKVPFLKRNLLSFSATKTQLLVLLPNQLSLLPPTQPPPPPPNAPASLRQPDYFQSSDKWLLSLKRTWEKAKEKKHCCPSWLWPFVALLSFILSGRIRNDGVFHTHTPTHTQMCIPGCVVVISLALVEGMTSWGEQQ